MQTTVHTITATLNKDIEINVVYNTIQVYTSYSEDKKTKYLTIKIEKEIEETESVIVVKNRITWLKLTILDVLCFLTNEPFILSDFDKTETVKGNLDKVNENIFFENGIDKIPDFKKMIQTWENSDEMQQKIMSNKLRLKRYQVIERSGKIWK